MTSPAGPVGPGARQPDDGRRPVIDLRRVTKIYGEGAAEVRAVAGVDLVVHRGDYVAVMGASGSGKSTLMNIIGCLDVPTSGRYLLDGVDTRRLDEKRQALLRNRKIGFIFQSFNLIPRTSALANVELPLAYAGIGTKRRRELAVEALERVGLADRLRHTPNELSGGQQQRVAVARALVTSPVLLLADEPTGALDSRSTAEMLDLFGELNEAGRTLMVITHEGDVAEPGPSGRADAGRSGAGRRAAAARRRRCRRRRRRRGGGRVNLRQSFGFAVRGVTANKLRSALTTLGILIGVAAVIILVAVGTGSGKAVQDSISRLGSNTLTVTASQGGTGGRGGFGAAFGGGGARVVAPPGGGAAAGGAAGPGGAAGSGGAAGTVSTGTQTHVARLTLEDAEALNDRTVAPHVVSVAPVVSASSVTATYQGATHTVGTFYGTTPSYLVNDNDSVQAGSPFTDSDYTQRHRVALVGITVATDLYGGTGLDIVGRTVQFNGIAYQVVGVLTAKGSTGPQDQDDRVLAPLTAVQDTLSGYGTLSSISVKAATADDVALAQAEVQDVLNGRHHVGATNPDYSVFSPASLLSAVTSTTQTFTVLLASVAAISLLVGGIGVMNIMLVTVTERTREIGIRKAIGAQRRDIVGQFLIEAVLLSLFGGLMGVVVGLVGSRFTIVGVQPVVAPYSVGLAFGVSVAVGLFFGLYPANRAASLRPIDALRYE